MSSLEIDELISSLEYDELVELMARLLQEMEARYLQVVS